MTLPSVRSEHAQVVRVVNAAFARLPKSVQDSIEIEWDDLDMELERALQSDDRIRALNAIEAFRSHWLALFRKLGQQGQGGDRGVAPLAPVVAGSSAAVMTRGRRSPTPSSQSGEGSHSDGREAPARLRTPCRSCARVPDLHDPHNDNGRNR